MHIPITKFRNNQLAAQALRHYLDADSPEASTLTIRPWNRFDPSFTTWLFIPGNEWPAYSRSKLYLSQANETEMSVGFYIERGLGQSAREFVKPGMIMQRDWAWHHFVKACQKTAFAEAIERVLHRTQLPLALYVSLYHANHVPDYDSGENEPDDQLKYTITDASSPIQQTADATVELTCMNGAKTIAELVSLPDTEPSFEWHWLNLYMGVQVQYSEDDTGEWGTRDLWEHTLAPWMPLVY